MLRVDDAVVADRARRTGHGGDEQLDVAGDQIGIGRRSPFVRYKNHVEACGALEQFRRQMRGVARHRAEIELSRFRLDQRDQLLDVVRRK